jgi:hypothetical protein
VHREARCRGVEPHATTAHLSGTAMPSTSSMISAIVRASL